MSENSSALMIHDSSFSKVEVSCETITPSQSPYGAVHTDVASLKEFFDKVFCFGFVFESDNFFKLATSSSFEQRF